ncbi:hypothetical protein BDB00DRAFT_803392 [Zychaea mexicana]|uniref:uncharacterized protein n=1 Tax=Zychaea mexicana TaxID=64656 RepID=UPI0022FEE47A|nr:uncharacterized protein BDB00DRAFT_803392 [Zychaea mexicana]KAI9497622.1 hypothetical protein BDB00DRAFT_803392 [Zychaea mexicana]
MTDSWDRTLFDKELKSILDAKLPVSASKITSLQSLAISHPQHHNYITQCILRFIETAPPDYRLAGLYVVDAISRAAYKLVRKSSDSDRRSVEAEGYLRRFGIVLRDDTLIGCFEPCTPKDKEKVKKVLDIWEHGGIYSKDLVDYLRNSSMKVAATGTTERGHNSATSATAVATTTTATTTTNGDMQQHDQQTSKAPAIDAASLLAQLSTLSNGNLGNLTNAVPSAPPSQPFQPFQQHQQHSLPQQPLPPTLPQQHQQPSRDTAGLPPALAHLLGINAAPAAAPQAAPPPPPLPLVQLQQTLQQQPQRLPSSVPNFPSMMPPPQPPLQDKAPVDPRLRSHQPSPPPRVDPRVKPNNANNTPLGVRSENPPHHHNYQQQQQQQPQQPLSMSPPRTRSRPSRWNQDSAPVPFQQPDPHHYQQQQEQRRRSLSPVRGQNNNNKNHPNQHSHHRHSPSSRQEQRHPRRRSSLPGPIPDPSLPKGCIRVVTRTLFVGPLPGNYTRDDVADIFEKYGELNSIIVSKKIKSRVNAFLKYTKRASLEQAKRNTADLMVEDVRVKVNYGFGFGPRKLFDYERGESVISLNELSEDEKMSLVTAPIGGFQGQQVHDQMTIEEPEVEYRPEWKMDENSAPKGGGSGGGGGRRGGGGNRHIRRRFDSSNEDHPRYQQRDRQYYQQQQQPELDVSADSGWMTGGAQFPPQQQLQMSNVPPNFFFDMQQQLQRQEQQMQQQQQHQHQQYQPGSGDDHFQRSNYDYS